MFPQLFFFFIFVIIKKNNDKKKKKKEKSLIAVKAMQMSSVCKWGGRTLMDADEVGAQSQRAGLVQFPGRRRHDRHQAAHLRDVRVEFIPTLLLRPVTHLPTRTNHEKTTEKKTQY